MHSTNAIDYRQGSKSEINFKGTSLMPEAMGKADIAPKSGSTQISAKLEDLKPANSFGLEYLTYVLWAVSPEGVPSNLGELIVKDGKSELHASTPMQAFALIVTAEPYFAVTQPSDKIVAENELGANVQGAPRTIDVNYEVFPEVAYSAQVQPIGEPVYGIDKRVPLSLKEARNAVRIAKDAHADDYAAPSLQRAQQLLNQADNYYNRKQNDKAIATVAREATQAAEAARVMALKAERQAKIDEKRRTAEEAAEKAKAEAESQARQAQQAQAEAQAQAQRTQQAEAARQQAEQQAEQQASQAQAAAQQAAAAAQAAQQQVQAQTNSGEQALADQQAAAQRAQSQADAARQAALAAQQRAQDQERTAREAEQELQQEQAARQQAEQQVASSQQQLEQTQQQLTQAQTEKEQVRQRLLEQLDQVLQTKDTARGLVVNMPDVLFNVNSSTLKPTARERLAKVAGILIAYPDIHVEVDGYTDTTGALDYNQRLSQERADAVRSYLVQQGVPSTSIEAKGFGPNDPVAPNATPEGRQQNRRVNLVVSGESIGARLNM